MCFVLWWWLCVLFVSQAVMIRLEMQGIVISIVNGAGALPWGRSYGYVKLACTLAVVL